MFGDGARFWKAESLDHPGGYLGLFDKVFIDNRFHFRIADHRLVYFEKIKNYFTWGTF